MSKTLSPLAVDLVSARASLKFFREQVKQLNLQVKHERFALENDKVVKAEEKRAAAIAKAQARLDKLLSKSVGAVGAKAIKANKRPSKAVTYGAEANQLAEKIKAGVSTI